MFFPHPLRVYLWNTDVTWGMSRDDLSLEQLFYWVLLWLNVVVVLLIKLTAKAKANPPFPWHSSSNATGNVYPKRSPQGGRLIDCFFPAANLLDLSSEVKEHLDRRLTQWPSGRVTAAVCCESFNEITCQFAIALGVARASFGALLQQRTTIRVCFVCRYTPTHQSNGTLRTLHRKRHQEWQCACGPHRPGCLIARRLRMPYSTEQ